MVAPLSLVFKFTFFLLVLFFLFLVHAGFAVVATRSAFFHCARSQHRLEYIVRGIATSHNHSFIQPRTRLVRGEGLEAAEKKGKEVE